MVNTATKLHNTIAPTSRSPTAVVDIRGGQDFNCGDFYTRHSLVGDPDCLRGAARKVEAAAAYEWTAIVDAHSHRAPILWILDFHD